MMEININNLKFLYGKALEIARKAHAGQTDKAGMPYFLHSVRVADRCRSLEEKITALLHDTIEDTDVTPDFLLTEGFPTIIVDAVLSVTRRNDENYEDFINRCETNPIGREVKIHDLEDNMDITRLRVIDEADVIRLRKYLKAYRKLVKNDI